MNHTDAQNKAIHSKVSHKGYSKSVSSAIKGEREHVANRHKNMAAGGFKDEHDYFANVNPFTGKRRGT